MAPGQIGRGPAGLSSRQWRFLGLQWILLQPGGRDLPAQPTKIHGQYLGRCREAISFLINFPLVSFYQLRCCKFILTESIVLKNCRNFLFWRVSQTSIPKSEKIVLRRIKCLSLKSPGLCECCGLTTRSCLKVWPGQSYIGRHGLEGEIYNTVLPAFIL